MWNRVLGMTSERFNYLLHLRSPELTLQKRFGWESVFNNKRLSLKATRGIGLSSIDADVSHWIVYSRLGLYRHTACSLKLANLDWFTAQCNLSSILRHEHNRWHPCLYQARLANQLPGVLYRFWMNITTTDLNLGFRLIQLKPGLRNLTCLMIIIR